MYKSLSFTFFLIIFLSLWGIWVISTHPKNAIVSWDEGFHGGSALYISSALKDNFNFDKYTYILDDFKNGVIWYPPFWLLVAGILGAITSPSVEVYRFATLIFGVASIVSVAFFIKSIHTIKGALIAALALAMTPLFIIYSHLMMREVPLLFGVSIGLLFFYRYLVKPNLKRSDFFITAAALSVAVTAKIIGILIVFLTVFMFGICVFIWWRESNIGKRLFQKPNVFLLLIPLIVFNLYRIYTRNYLNADMLDFFLDQSNKISASRTIDLQFYLRDFSHMLPLSLFWLGSALGFTFLFRKSPIVIFIVSWIVATYAAFNGVKPQAIQYILPIFAPVAVAVGLFWGELFRKIKKPFLTTGIFLGLILGIVFTGVSYISKTEAIVWRDTVTNQEQAAKYIAENAHFGERVIVNGDGTRFLIRLAGFKKNLQTINGASTICPDSIQDSVEWGIYDFGPQNPVKLESIKSWDKQASFGGSPENIVVYKNPKLTHPFVISGDNLEYRRCARWFLLGLNTITFYATPVLDPNTRETEPLKIMLRTNLVDPIVQSVIPQDVLKNQIGKDAKYTLIIDHSNVNRWIYYSFHTPDNLKLNVHRIEISNVE